MLLRYYLLVMGMMTVALMFVSVAVGGVQVALTMRTKLTSHRRMRRTQLPPETVSR